MKTKEVRAIELRAYRSQDAFGKGNFLLQYLESML
jgi:hypothetical protein